MGLPVQTRRGGIAAGLARTRASFGVYRVPFPPKDPDETPLTASTQSRDGRDSPVDDRADLRAALQGIKEQMLPRVLDRIDAEAAAKLTIPELTEEMGPIIAEVLAELKVMLNRREQMALQKLLIDETLAHGPIEELLSDPTVSDIMVNGPNQVYVERSGRIELTDIRFSDDAHVLRIAQRICNRIGRRVDQTNPIADARLEDGSRVNVILPPLSLKGPALSIRRFGSKPITLDMMAHGGNCSTAMANFLEAAAASRLNIVVSGGTGSGKTTLLNALSRMIDPGERVITVEDAAELRLQQPHVLTLETRQANIDGQGQVTIRDLVVNALRMRPDRIILGEVRGPECFDMLQAMNTGHDGSMCTLHANSPREALSRMENMVLMSNIRIPKEAITRQIADSIDLIVQIKRMRDGKRRIVSISEVVGQEGSMTTLQELFFFRYDGEAQDGSLSGRFVSTGLRPYTLDKARQFGLEQTYLEACL